MINLPYATSALEYLISPLDDVESFAFLAALVNRSRTRVVGLHQAPSGVFRLSLCASQQESRCATD